MPIDIILVITALLGFYIGYSNGIIHTVFTVASILIGLLMAFKFAPTTGKLLEDLFHTENALMYFAGFLLSFVVTMVFIRMMAKVLESILEKIQINFVNKLAGGVLSSFTMVLIYSVILKFGVTTTVINNQTILESKSYTHLETLPAKAKQVALHFKPLFEDVWEQTVVMLEKMDKMTAQKTESSPELYDIPEEN